MIEHDVLTELFSSKVRAAVLTRMLPRPHLGYSLTELARLLDLPVSSLQHECYKLERIGIIQARRVGAARPYRVVAESPVRLALTALILAAIGPARVLRGAVEGVTGLQVAFLAGDLPRPTEPSPAARSRCFLVLVGEIPLDELDETHRRVETVLGIPSGTIELAFFRPNDWRARIEQGNPHALELLGGPRIDLVAEARKSGR